MPLPQSIVKNMSTTELQIAITYWQGITGDPGKKTLAQLKAELAERRAGGGGGRGGGAGARSLATLLKKNSRLPRAPVNRFDPESNPNQYKREETRRREAEAAAAAAAELKRKKDEFHAARAFQEKVQQARAALTHRSPGKVDEEELEAAMLLLGQWNGMGGAKRELWASDDWARANETLGEAMVNLRRRVDAVLAAKEEIARGAGSGGKEEKGKGLLGWGLFGLGGGRRRRRRRKTRRRRRRRKTRRGGRRRARNSRRRTRRRKSRRRKRRR